MLSPSTIRRHAPLRFSSEWRPSESLDDDQQREAHADSERREQIADYSRCPVSLVPRSALIPHLAAPTFGNSQELVGNVAGFHGSHHKQYPAIAHSPHVSGVVRVLP